MKASNVMIISLAGAGILAVAGLMVALRLSPVENTTGDIGGKKPAQSLDGSLDSYDLGAF